MDRTPRHQVIMSSNGLHYGNINVIHRKHLRASSTSLYYKINSNNSTKKLLPGLTHVNKHENQPYIDLEVHTIIYFCPHGIADMRHFCLLSLLSCLIIWHTDISPTPITFPNFLLLLPSPLPPHP